MADQALNELKSKDYFSNEWWKLFLKKTQRLNKTKVFKRCLTKDETSFMRGELMNIVSILSKMRTRQFGYRVFLDGLQLGYKDMESIYDNAPHSNESLEDWALRSFGNKKFGMIINRGEKFSPILAESVSEKIAPFLEKIGVPRLGITFTIFIGNYGWTPIGIHKDSIGENVLHFHLGPGIKTMYTWNSEKYEEKTTPIERMNNKKIEKHIEYANAYNFGEGDLYFMPSGEYHVGRSDELSMGLTLWFNNHTKNQLSKKAIQVIINQYLEDNNYILPPDTNTLDNFEGFEESLNLFNIPEELNHLTFKEILSESYKDFRYSLYSNGGFWARPFPIEKHFEFSLDVIVKKPFIYSILYHDSIGGKKLYVYVRGTKIVFDNHLCIKKMIDELNKGEKIKVVSLIRLLDNDWEESIGFYILNCLYLHHGIIIIE